MAVVSKPFTTLQFGNQTFLKDPIKLNYSSVKVQFIDTGSTEEVVQKIGELVDPHVVLWYIGTYGLKKEAVSFYQKSIISPIIAENQNASFILVDLTAWGALRSANLRITQSSRHVKTINSLKDRHIECFASSEFFRKIQDIQCPKILNYFLIALRRPFIRQSSLDAKTVGFTTRSVFSGNCSILKEYMDVDASRIYSILQYLEGLFLIEKILQNFTKEIINIAFALPNDELKYYRDENDSFQEDLIVFLEARSLLLERPRQVNVYFYSYPYGVSFRCRPYNSPGKVLKNVDLKYEDLVINNLNLLV